MVGGTVNAANSEEHASSAGRNQSTLLLSADRNNAPIRSWRNLSVKPRCSLLCIHGFGLHSGSYDKFAQHMAEHGIDTYTIDVRGFGSWMKAEGHTRVDFESCLDDIKVALQAIRKANPNTPLFLLGESMGGAIALQATAQFPELIDGVVSAVPAADRYKQKRTELKVALQFIGGRDKQHNVGDEVTRQASNDEQLRDHWEDDSLARMDLSASELIEFQKFMSRNHDAARQITKTSVLMIQGSDDRLVKADATWKLFNEQATEEKAFLAVPSEHLIFEEEEHRTQSFNEQIAQLVMAWIDAHLPDSQASKDMPVATNDSSKLMVAAKQIAAGRLAEAQKLLNVVLRDEPQDARAHFLLGAAYTKLNNAEKAKAELTTAISLTADTHLPTHAYHPVVSNHPQQAPGSANGNPLPAAVLKMLHGEGKPCVLAFYAPWMQQCEQLDSLFGRAAKLYGGRLRLLKINVDDRQNEEIVNACSVGPVPTILYLSANGHIAATAIGTPDFDLLTYNLSSVLR